MGSRKGIRANEPREVNLDAISQVWGEDTARLRRLAECLGVEIHESPSGRTLRLMDVLRLGDGLDRIREGLSPKPDGQRLTGKERL